MISDKDKLDLIHNISTDALEFSPGTEDAVGYLSAILNVVNLIVEHGEGEEA